MILENLKNINEFIEEIKEFYKNPVGKVILEKSGITISDDKKEKGLLVIGTDAKPGDYLYSDLSWSTELIEGKKVVGICVKARGELDDKARFISIVNMSLKTPRTGTIETGNDLEKNSGAGIRWGEINKMIYTSNTNGCRNTKIVKNLLSGNREISNDPEDYPAFQVCYRFNAGEKDLSGKWFLPAKSELENIKIDLVNEKLKPLVEKGLAVYIGSRNTFFGNIFGSFLWSSTESNKYSSWYLTINNSLRGDGNFKDNTYEDMRIRAMIAV